ncbi:MAG: hypothetical protein RIQ53_2355, partial [Pseudomonadota bacterium]
MPHPALAALPHQLPDLDWITEPSRVARLSQDHHWFSPVLRRELAGRQADSVVRPRTEDEIRRVVAACARAGAPLTLRGSGSNCRGHSVPLHGGLLMDLSGYASLCWVHGGTVRAQAGMRLCDLDRALVPHGQELRCLPSSYRSATVGGLFAGGSWGAGAITWGPPDAEGNVLGLRLMTVEPEPRVIELRAPEALALYHGCGTNGIVLELELALAPAQPWVEQVVCFPTLEAALHCGGALAHSPGIAKKEICLLGSALVPCLPHLAELVPAGHSALLLLVDEAGEPGLRQLVERHGGHCTLRQDAHAVRRGRPSLLESTWGHTTLHALKADRTLTHLQTVHDPSCYPQQVLALQQALGDELMPHLEFVRTAEGRISCRGLPLLRFRDEARLRQIEDLHRAHGVQVIEAHACSIGDGFSPTALATLRATQARHDPLGLLNPGKLRTRADGGPGGRGGLGGLGGLGGPGGTPAARAAAAAPAAPAAQPAPAAPPHEGAALHRAA